MTEPHIKLVKSNGDIVGVWLYYAILGAWLYYTLNPSALETVKTQVRNRWDFLTHLVSVWQARHAIRSLPEID